MASTKQRADGRLRLGGHRRENAGWIERLAEIQATASVDAAKVLTLAVVEGWWSAVTQEHAVSENWAIAEVPTVLGSLSPAVRMEAAEIGRDLAKLPVEDASGLIGRLYTRCLPEAVRGLHGVFYTPAALVGLLLDRVEDDGHNWLSGRSIDPSCGGGAFLVQIAVRMVEALAHAEPSIALKAIETGIVGWDLDPFAAWLAQVSLEIVTLPLAVKAGRRPGRMTAHRDSLSNFRDGVGRFDLVVGNPPFGKIKDNEAIRSEFARSLYGHPNLYGLFTDLALRLAKPRGGRIAYLTPGSFLAGHYFKRLRQLLASEAPPVTVDFVASRREVFDDVLQEVVLSTFVRGRKRSTVRCRSVAVASDGLVIRDTGVVSVSTGTAPWILPRTESDAPLVAGLAKMPTRLADWGYRVSTGPLVWNRHKAQLHEKPGAGRIPVIWAEAVQSGGKFQLQGARRGHKGWFAPRPRDRAMIVREPCVLIQRTTATEQKRRLISAALPPSVIKKHGEVTVENHLNMVVSTVGNPPVTPSQLAKFLASGVADRVLRCINASVAVSASELEAMPLPSPAQVTEALKHRNPEATLRRLYGLDA